VDGGSWHLGFDVSLTLRTGKRGGGSGIHTIEYWTWDKALNQEVPRSCQVKLDAKPPTTLCDAPACRRSGR